MNLGHIVSDPAYPQLKAYVLAQTGLEYYVDKDEDFAYRLNRRLSALSIYDCARYLAILEQTAGRPSEMDALVGELTIGETYFFREKEHFDLLRSTILPELFDRNSEMRRLKIWSAGCATGAEPYSIAILLKTAFANRLRHWDLSLIGSDININFLDQARQAVFSKWALRDVPAAFRERCFQHEDAKWILNPGYRGMVEFQYHNLALDPDPPLTDAFDLIVCRNVLIYFSPETIQQAAAKFFRALTEGGWLLIGHAEHNAALFQPFEQVPFPGATAYRKLSPKPREQAAAPSVPVWKPLDAPAPRTETPREALIAPEPERPLASCHPYSMSLLEDARRLADRGKWLEAAGICRNLVAEDSLNAGARLTLGLVLAHSGAIREAASELQKAIYADRQFVLAHYHLGTLRQAAGDLEAARRSFRTVLDLLRARAGDEPVDFGDGIRVGELAELAEMHQESLGR